LVWKNADSAFHGVGDIDGAADISEWEVIESVFADWADARGLGPTVVCHHSPGGLKLLAVTSGAETYFELDAKADRLWRGSRLFGLEDLTAMSVMDPRGFRRLRPGAEAFYKLLMNGTRWSGRPDREAITSKAIREGLREDPEGVRLATRGLGPARHAALVGARHAAAGGWSWPAMIAVQGWAVLRSLAAPRTAVARLRFRSRGRVTCAVMDQSLRHHRRVPTDTQAWIERLSQDHSILRGRAR
jgi:hypothetical protein